MSRSVPSLPASAAAVLRSSGEGLSGGQGGVMTSSLPLKEARWKPGLPKGEQHPSHTEIFASANEASGAGLALALARDALAHEEKGAGADKDDQRAMLWVQTRDAIRRSGRPYIHGLPHDWHRRLIHVEVESAADALFALEEGVRCAELAFVIGEIAGNPRELDFTASRRLTLTAQRHGVRLYLVRLDAQRDLSSARMRWNVRSAPSPRPRWNGNAPGIPSWNAELFRARAHPPGTWTLRDEYDASQSGLAISQPPVFIPQAANAVDNASIAAPDHGDLARSTVGRALAAL